MAFIILMTDDPHIQAAVGLFRQHNAMLRTSQALALGIHPRTLYALRDSGVIVQLTRGLFRLAEPPPLEHPDLVTVALRVPEAVLCLISALALYDITPEIPHEVHIALPRSVKAPRLEHPPIRVYHFSGAALTEGVETVMLDDTPVKVYGPEKSVVDCFRFRNSLGLEVALEALKLCIARKGSSPRQILHFARLCRMERVMRPYLEALS